MLELRPAALAPHPQEANYYADTASEPPLDRVFRSRPVEIIAPGKAIFRQADLAKDVYEIRRGVIRLYRVLIDGKRAVVGFAFSGDILGAGYEERHFFAADAVTEVELRRIPRRDFHVCVDGSPALRPVLLSKIYDEVSAAQQQLLRLHRTSNAAVASFLLALSRRLNGHSRNGSAVKLLMTRADIADYLGLTVETVCRSIGKLKTKGFITLHGPHYIILNRPHLLRELAGEERLTETDACETPRCREAAVQS